MTTRPRCDICRAPLNEQGYSARGQDAMIYRCATCYSTAVISQGEAERLYRETRDRLARERV